MMYKSSTPVANQDDSVLQVKDLQVEFTTPGGILPAVRHVSFTLKKGETLGIVGESGSGKSVTALSILQLLAKNTSNVKSGEIILDDRDLLSLTKKQMQAVRGNEISMIFQEPMTSLNPLLRIGRQVSEVFRKHLDVSAAEAKQMSIEILRKVGLRDPERRYSEFPYQISGGMRQRVMIAIALACHPKLLIADEPTTALDVTIQAQILDLIQQLKDESNMSVIMITHDLGVVAEMIDQVVVMYAGQVVETGDVHEIFETPSHPYTKALIEAVPKLGSRTKSGQRSRLAEIPGTVPNLLTMPEGCAFAERCAYAQPKCHQQEPDLSTIAERRSVRCHFSLHNEGGEL